MAYLFWTFLVFSLALKYGDPLQILLELIAEVSTVDKVLHFISTRWY